MKHRDAVFIDSKSFGFLHSSCSPKMKCRDAVSFSKHGVNHIASFLESNFTVAITIFLSHFDHIFRWKHFKFSFERFGKIVRRRKTC